MCFLHHNTGEIIVKSHGLKNVLAASVYFAGAHGIDALYALTCMEFSYFNALGIMFVVLASVSIVLVVLHERINQRTGWDALGLDGLNRLKDGVDTSPNRVSTRIKKWLMKRRLTIFIFGSCLVGPPVVTILLRKNSSIADSVFYILSGTLISVVTWVTVWKGFWSILQLYIQPAVQAWTA